MRLRLPRPLVALVALLLAGCLPESKNPLSPPASSLIDARLEGVYAQRDKDGKENPGYWHFHFRGRRTASGQPPATTPWLEILTVEPAKDGGLRTTRYEALATRLGGHDYFSFMTLSPDGVGTKVRPYSFARYEVNWRGDLRIWIAKSDAFVAAVKAGKLRGKIIHGKWSDDAELSDTTERLAAFVAAADPKDLFGGEPVILRRIAR